MTQKNWDTHPITRKVESPKTRQGDKPVTRPLKEGEDQNTEETKKSTPDVL